MTLDKFIQKLQDIVNNVNVYPAAIEVVTGDWNDLPVEGKKVEGIRYVYDDVDPDGTGNGAGEAKLFIVSC